jgi:thiol-disulfide isomerase/thioredoxin
MRTFLIFILFTGLAFSQSKYTKEDQEFADHVKEVWKSSDNDNYIKQFTELITECNNYLKGHPNTAIKPGLLGYIFEMTAALDPGALEVRKAGDALLRYDSSFKTSLRVAQILIEKKLDDKRGIEIVRKIIPEAQNPKDYYDANLLLASGELHLKNYKSSIYALNAAVKSDSSRVDGYKGLLQVMPLAGEERGLQKVKEKLSVLEKDPNINVDLSSFSFFDINEEKVEIKNFQGAPLVLVFFRFECPYCRKEMPVFQELIKKHPDLKFIFINLEEAVQDIKFKYLKEDKYSFLKDQTIAKFTDAFDNILDITITPQTLIVDKNSVVKYDFRGYRKDFPGKFEDDIKSLK